MEDNGLTEFRRNDMCGKKTEVPSATHTGKILLVDDDIDALGVLHNYLEECGFTITSTLSSGKALELLRTQSFDLLISDLDMPEMDGIALLHAALDIDPDMIGIIITGHGSIGTAVDAMKAGAFDYLLKPFRFRMLLPVCSRAMRVRHLSRSERRHRMLVDELTLIGKKLDNTAKKTEVRELEMVEMKEEIEGLKAELAGYRRMENQLMFYES